MTRDIDWGIPVPLDGLARQPHQAALRLVRRGRRLPLGVGGVGAPHRRPGALAGVVERPDRPVLLLHGQGQHHLPLPDLAGRAARLRRQGRQGRRAAGASASSTCPTEVVSSEFLTMEGRKFSSSKRVVIYVRDMLARYQVDAFRYFVAAAGPENQDSDFTWAEFVRRTNDELVAGWGNLVNRTATLIAKNFGEIPAAGELTADRPGAARQRRRSVRRRRRPHRAAPAEAGDRRGDARRRRGQQVRLRLRALEAQGRGRSGSGWARCCTSTAQAVSDCNTMLSPFLPHSANAVDARARRRAATSSRCRASRRSTTSTAAPATRSSPATTPARRAWERRPIAAGTPVAKPTPVFTKLDAVGRRRGAGPDLG